MNPPLTVNVPHKLGAAEARRRVDEGFGQLAGQMPQGMAQIEKSWKDNRLSFSAMAMGQVATGHLDVTDEAVEIVVHLPGLLGVMAGTIAGKLRREGQILLEKK